MADEPREPRKTLSSNLKQMKFMQRRSEADLRKKLEEERRRVIDESHWVLDTELGDNNRNIIEVEPSYLYCEELYANGRMSFRNFNPTVEKMFREMVAQEEEMLSEAREREATISDKEMARRYGTLVGTIGKKFTTKRKRSTTGENVSDSPTNDRSKKKTKREFMKPRD